jgi:outer membrane protein assembly factor BamB
MSIGEPSSRKPLRLWPGVALAVLLVVVRLMPIVVDEIMPVAMMGAVVGGLLIPLWWLFFSRAPWSERLGVIVLMIVALFATSRLVHESIAGGAMGFLFYVWAIPVMSVALVASLVASRRLSSRSRRASIGGAILLACGVWTLVRTEGVTSDLVGSDFRWRWTPTPEQRLLAQAADNPPVPAPAAAAEIPKESVATKATDSPVAPAAPTTAKAPATTPDPPATALKAPAVSDPGFRRADGPAMSERGSTRVEWPGFRGPDRNSIVRGVRIETDWSTSPPVELWRRPIGPGWSSFAVAGDVLFTQEQRGDDEIVAAYRLTTGEPVWRHRDAARFYESNAGAGPRGTPTLSNGRVYTLGATGIVNALDASNGAVVWSRNAVTDTGVTIPGWGIASSPLIVNDMVVVAASGRLAAYDAATGKPRWYKTTGGGGYSSPHLATIDGVTQIMLLSGGGLTSVAPADGAVLWQHPLWQSAIGIVQPSSVDGDLLIAAGDAMGGIGMRRLAIAHGPSGWTAEERWTSRGLKPYFNDFVVHKGHAFGFDGSILSCIDVKDGARKWKGGRYGSGQLVLLADQDLLLIVSEEGELALVKATPDQFTEVMPRLPAIEGKTWNHPVLIGDLLLVRNGQEMAAFRLSRAGPDSE